ncbi:MAG: chemotaxis protein CheB [Alphaproteobacteria bacterium]
MPKRQPPPKPESSPPAPDSPGGPTTFSVVGIGASAGGLDACRKLLAALPSGDGLALILIQHLDPTHESMMVELLSGSTAMTVQQAAQGMTVERNHVYVIPPGFYLSVADDVLHLSRPEARHGARMPFDFLLHSLAEAYGERAVCVVLSGTGADGSIGLKAVSDRGGLVIAQDPEEAAYDGMPQSAIVTGLVRYVLPLADIPGALLNHAAGKETATGQDMPPSGCGKEIGLSQVGLSQVIELLHTRNGHNFSKYKAGTLERRIGRRMASLGLEGDTDRYMALLRNDPVEIDLLARDLLIHVTSFFRDPEVFEFLSETVIPDLVNSLGPGQPIRIWVAGCSTGEETYSLAMLFREKIVQMKSNARLQIFASDLDAEAIAQAREGLYPATISNDISPDRLKRFFSKEEQGYRVLPELRDPVLFTVQNVLADPPFSRLDLVSCRNLLIYLKPEAQAQVISQFHFALRQGGILLLGGSETVGNDDERFAVVSKPLRVYRHIGRRRPGEFGVALRSGEGVRPNARPDSTAAPSYQEVLADLCRNLVLESYAPAAILINRDHECLFFLGPTNRYLQVATGYPTHDLLAMVGGDLRTRLRSAIQQATQTGSRVDVSGCESRQGRKREYFDIAVEPVEHEGRELLLICFFDQPARKAPRQRPIPSEEMSRVAELERELQATRMELEGAIVNLENSSQKQKAVNQEALSINEEYQSTNEELETSKEELQSLNEELTALNTQLHETLEQQRTTGDDLQNILYSTDVATLFLDLNLRIRFFTPASRSMFNVIPSDIGRPIADLSSLASDGHLETDSLAVIATHELQEREIQCPGDIWYIRRILPYRAQGNSVEGVVITFTDITEQKKIAEALNVAVAMADQANMAKTRFLAAASHDLRQPLQTLALLQGILAKTVQDEEAQKLIARIDETLGAMARMLNALLDINEIEAGTLLAEKSDFPIDELIDRLRDEFGYYAQAMG